MDSNPFTVRTDRAIAELRKRVPAIGFAGHASTALTRIIAEVTRVFVFERGLSARETASELQGRLTADLHLSETQMISWLPGGTTHSLPAQLSHFVCEAAAFARHAAFLKELADCGSTHYEIMSVGAPNTCSVCRMLDGLRLPLGPALKHIELWRAATTPEDARRVHPWPTEDLVRACLAVRSETSRALEQAGILVPPFEADCRCVVEVEPWTEDE